MDARHIYLQVVDKVRQHIAIEGLQVGDKLDPEVDLCKITGCSRMTLRRALEILDEEGIIEKRKPLGTFIRRAPSSASMMEFRVPRSLSSLPPILKIEALPPYPRQNAFWEKTYALFRKNHPGVAIKMSQDQAWHKETLEGGIAPAADILILPTWSFVHYKERGWLMPLDSIQDRDSCRDCFHEFLDYGHPFFLSTNLFLANRRLCESAGLKLDDAKPIDFDSFLKILSKVSGKAPFALSASPGYPGVAVSGIILDRRKWKLIPGMIREAFEKLISASGGKMDSRLRDRSFLSGDSVFLQATTGKIPEIIEAAQFPVTCLRQPQAAGVPQHHLAFISCVSAHASNPRLAKEFAEFLYSSEVQNLMLAEQFEIPARKDLDEERVNPKFKKLHELAETAISAGCAFDSGAKDLPEFGDLCTYSTCMKMMCGELSPAEGESVIARDIASFMNGEIGWGISH
jgi:hypothetical protein